MTPLPSLAAVRGARADVTPSAADPLERFRAAQARKAAEIAARTPVDHDERRRAIGGRPDVPPGVKSYAYRRCGTCLWVFRPAQFRMDRLRRYWADCPVCREIAAARKGVAS